MLFTAHKNLFRNLFSNNTFKLLCCGIAIVNILAAPSFAAKSKPVFDATEYEEWGLDYPGKNPQVEDKADSDKPATPPVRTQTGAQPPTTQTPVSQSSLPTGGAVPQDIADSIQQTAVHVIVFYADGKHMVMPGWIVDTQRRIIMTFNLIKGAEKIQVAYPQVTDVPDDKVSGSSVVVLKHDTDMEYVYLQANFMPETLANLTVSAPSTSQTANRPVVANKPTAPTAPTPPTSGGQNNGGFNTGGQQGGFQRPTQPHNPLVGRWYLQDTVNGTRIQIGVAFDAQGQYAMEMVAVDGYGQQSQDSTFGTYTVQGNTLIINSEDGVERSNFRVENGQLHVYLTENDTTLIFQPAS